MARERRASGHGNRLPWRAEFGSGWPGVSVIVPVCRDGKALGPTLASVAAQDYPGPVEIVVADGGLGCAEPPDWHGLRVVANPDGTTAAGLNRALSAAVHGVIARCDAGCVLPGGYLRCAVALLRATGAVNVGGRQRPVGVSVFERAAAAAMAHPLGAGNARYRIGGPAGPVDTVFLGVFRRTSIESVGGFDETLLRNQDYDLNWRLRRAGGTVWFDPRLSVDYRPRGSFAALARQYFDYGRWKRAMLRRHPRALRWRQAAPPLLVLSLAASAAAAGAAAALQAAWPALAQTLLAAAWPAPTLWTTALCATALHRAGDLGTRTLLAPVLATMHVAWGTGFLLGPGRRPGRADDGRPGA